MAPEAPQPPKRGRPKLADRLLPPVTKSDHLSRRLWRLKNHLVVEQKELAALIGVDAGVMSRWITGKRYAGPKSLRRIEQLERVHGLPFDLPFPDRPIVLKGHRKKPRTAERKTIELEFKTVDPRRRVFWSQVEVESGIAGIERATERGKR